MEKNKNYTEHSSEICPDQKQYKLDVVYLRMAKEWATNSKCKRSQVGCLVVKNKTIISDGYNGTPTGFPNECEDSDNNTLEYVLHAEANAITKLAKNTLSAFESTLYVTLSPCYACSKLIIQTGMKRIVFSEFYRNTTSLDLLNQAGIEIIYIKL